MNYATVTIGDSTSVAQRWGTNSTINRCEKLLDVLCFNNTGGVLYIQVHELFKNLVPASTNYSGSAYTLNGITSGQTYMYQPGNNEQSMTCNGVTITAGLFVAGATSCIFASTAAAGATGAVSAVVYPVSKVAPAEGSVPLYSFPVQGGLGGTLGSSVDISGIYCCWSSTQATKTIAAASGSINIIVKG